jgi:hypothetical protein
MPRRRNRSLAIESLANQQGTGAAFETAGEFGATGLSSGQFGSQLSGQSSNYGSRLNAGYEFGSMGGGFGSQSGSQLSNQSSNYASQMNAGYEFGSMAGGFRGQQASGLSANPLQISSKNNPSLSPSNP